MPTPTFLQYVVPVIGLIGLAGAPVRAGSGPYRVAVLVNDNSRESQELGQYYQEARGIPEAQIIHLSVPTNDTISRADFEFEIYQPVTQHLAAAGLDGQVDTVVYTRGMPYRVVDAGSYNGITAATFYGFKAYPAPTPSEPCSLPDATASAYYGLERAFADAAPADTPFLSTLLTAWTLEQAKELVDRSVIADGVAPVSQVLYLHSSDPDRNVRWPQTEGADFTRRLFNVLQTGRFLAANSVTGQTGVMGYMIGLRTVSGIAGNEYLPGAIADHVTSYAGILYTPTPPANPQMSLLDWIAAGVSGSYGTVTEPCNYTEKFPHARVHTRYARGFTLAESLAMSVANPYMGITVGDPLCAPYAVPPLVSVTGLTAGAVVSGARPFTVVADATAPDRPVDRIDLYLDDVFVSTLTQVGVTAGEQVSVTVGTQIRTYQLSATDDVTDVAAGLAHAINQPPPQLAVTAVASGDRVELIQKDLGRAGAGVSYGATISTGTSSTLRATAATSHLLETVYPARQELTLTGTPAAGDELQLVVTRLDGVPATNSVLATAGESAIALLNRLASVVNSDPLLTGSDGAWLRYRRFDGEDEEVGAVGYLEARDAGWETYNLAMDYRVIPVGGSSLSGPDYSGFLTTNRDVLSARGLVSIARGVERLSVSTSLETAVLADGPHTLRVVAFDGTAARVEGDTVIPFSVDNHDLACALTSPGGDEAFLYGQEVWMEGIAGGGVGEVTSVRFQVEGRVIAVASAPPFTASFPTTDIGIGRVTLQALARTDAGESTLSEPVDLLILNPDDTDHDDLPDGWEALHFTNITYTTGSIDSDGDGQDNTLEFIADTDPVDPAHRFAATELSLHGSQLTVRFPTRSTRRYGVQQSPGVPIAPANWIPATPDWFRGAPRESIWSGDSLAGQNYLRLAAEAPLPP